LDGAGYVAALTALVAAAQQDDHGLAVSREVQAIAWAMVDAQLRHTAADRLDVAKIAEREAADTGGDPGGSRSRANQLANTSVWRISISTNCLS
jgi:hypothetical protein